MFFLKFTADQVMVYTGSWAQVLYFLLLSVQQIWIYEKGEVNTRGALHLGLAKSILYWHLHLDRFKQLWSYLWARVLYKFKSETF